MKQNNEVIDFVIAWVDDSDPEWQMQRNQRAKQIMDTEQCDNRIERYRDWDNLRYWFRGVERFAPWVHKIHFVTWGHVPVWLNVNHPKLQIVRHEDYIPEKYLPTFNSNAIELNLHRIPGLAEQFVYFNDDMFLLKPVAPEIFYQEGKPKDMLALQPVVANDKDNTMPYIFLNNSMVLVKHFDKHSNMRQQPGAYWHPGYPLKNWGYNLLERAFPQFTGFYTVHGPAPFQRKTYEILWRKEAEVLNRTCSHPFRHREDINLYLLREWQKLSGEFVPTNVDKLCAYYNISANNNALLRTIRHQKSKMICINDSNLELDFESIKGEIQQAFATVLPDKCSYER